MKYTKNDVISEIGDIVNRYNRDNEDDIISNINVFFHEVSTALGNVTYINELWMDDVLKVDSEI